MGPLRVKTDNPSHKSIGEFVLLSLSDFALFGCFVLCAIQAVGSLSVSKFYNRGRVVGHLYDGVVVQMTRTPMEM